MTEDWAIKAAKRADEQGRMRESNLERNSRDSKLRNALGALLWQQLHKWMDAQIEEFNSIRGKQELSVAPGTQPNVNNQLDSTLRINRSGVSPLQISYSQIMHTITWECGSGRGQFHLVTDDNGTGQFETPYHVANTVEGMGAEILDKFMSTPF